VLRSAEWDQAHPADHHRRRYVRRSVDHEANRQGLRRDEAGVFSATFTDIVTTGSADRSWDFERDLKGVKADDIAMTNCTFNKGLDIEDYLTGPITHLTFDHSTTAPPLGVRDGTSTVKGSP
jgi:hypothetical protein